MEIDEDRLFDELAFLGPTDAAELAAGLGLAESAVQDWLDAQYAAGSCRFSALTARYWLSPTINRGEKNARS